MPPATTFLASTRRSAWAYAPGVALALAVAALAIVAERALAWPATVVALLAGMALHPVAARAPFKDGLTFCVKKVLRWGVALLGLRVALGDILALGPSVIVIVILSMTVTILSAVWLARAFGRDSAFGALAGGATAVCGASAALAVSTVLPRGPTREADTVFVVLAVNALSTVAMLLYPLVAQALGYDDRTTGILLGATIHDVAQVVGAGFAVSETAGASAVVVKLFRVFLLLPVVLGVGYGLARMGGEAGKAKVPVPVFAFVFLGFVALNSAGIVPVEIKAVGAETARWFLTMAIAALGLGTSVKAMTALGWKPLAVTLAATGVILACVILGLFLTA